MMEDYVRRKFVITSLRAAAPTADKSHHADLTFHLRVCVENATEQWTCETASCRTSFFFHFFDLTADRNSTGLIT